MVGGALVVMMFILGLALAGVLWPEWSAGMATPWRYVGWGLAVLAVLRWRVVLEGVRRSGKLLAFVLIVAAVALIFGGHDGLWNLFF